jgi:hypothetical protein
VREGAGWAVGGEGSSGVPGIHPKRVRRMFMNTSMSQLLFWMTARGENQGERAPPERSLTSSSSDSHTASGGRKTATTKSPMSLIVRRGMAANEARRNGVGNGSWGGFYSSI